MLPLVALANEQLIVQLTPGSEVEDLARHAWVAEDGSGQWLLADARRAHFRANEGAIINPGVSDATIWVRFDVRNAGEVEGSWVLSLDRVLVAVGEIFFVRADSVEHLLVNEPSSFQQSHRSFGTLAASLRLDAGESASVYIRYRGANWSGLKPLLIAEESFEFARNLNLAVFLALFGGIATLVLYGTISFALLGRGIVVLYGIAQLSFFAFFAHMSGLTTIYLLPDSPEIGRLFSPLTMGLFIASMAQFARLFFDTRTRVRRVDRLLQFCVGLSVLGIVLSPMDYVLPQLDRRIALYLIYVAAISSWLALPLLAAFATVRWDRSYWPIAIAWTLMSTYMIALMLVLLGVLVTIPLGEQSFVVVYLEAFFLALAITLRVREMKEDTVRAQEALNESLTQQLEESQRAIQLAEEREWALRDLAEKGRMLLAAGHDTRQMLTALRSFSGVLGRGVDIDQAQRLAGDLDQVANHLNNVMTTTLLGSRSGGIADDTIALQMQTVSSVLSPLELIHGDAARDKQIRLRIRLSSQRIVCDAVLVVRILSNLVSNAIKYTQSGGGVLIGCRAGSEDLRFQVWDTGTGIDEQKLQLLFARAAGGVRFDPAEEGSGVGLGIAHDLAARMGGQILAHSRPGKGSVFELVIPSTGIARSELPDIVVLDSDENQCRRLISMAENVGITVAGSTYPSATQMIASGKRPLLILVDQHFDGLDGGIRAATKLQELESVSAIVMMTFDQSATARATLAEHSDLILYKPVSAAVLLAAAARLRCPPGDL